jgi:hypothetical protein
MPTIPPSATHGLPTRPLTSRLIDRAAILGAIAFMAYGAFWPIFDEFPRPGIQYLTLVAIAVTVAGGFRLPRGSRPAFHALWVAFGMAAALGTIGIFSVGFAYLIAAALIVLAIVATPNNSEIELRYDWRYVVGFHIGYVLMLATLLMI